MAKRISPEEIFAERKRSADERIQSLRTALTCKLSLLPPSDRHPSLCIYATGSLARREATINSDLDAFFMLSDNEEERPIGRIRDVKILNAVLEAADENGFPDFSNDGEYLKFLHVDDVARHIGGREDDYKNAFTARMLMLLESCWIFEQSQFEKFQRNLIEVYFEDFHDHSKSFRPIFLLNDVLRFWRTLCLNYENGRHWRRDRDQSAKGHLDNLKLKFSRLNICFSFICHLLDQGPSLSHENALLTASIHPLQRLRDLRIRNPEIADKVAIMMHEYAWFLNVTGSPKDETLAWIGVEKNRITAFRHAAQFVENMGFVVRYIAEKNGYLRYLIV